jgi:hypothetical protein
VAIGLTITDCDEPKLVPVHFESLNAVTEYVPAGALVIVYVVDGWLVIVTGVTPSVYVNVKGAVPVNVNTILGNGDPEHTVPPPLTVTVGNGLTITATGVPKLVAEHVFASVNAVTE